MTDKKQPLSTGRDGGSKGCRDDNIECHPKLKGKSAVEVHGVGFLYEGKRKGVGRELSGERIYAGSRGREEVGRKRWWGKGKVS